MSNWLINMLTCIITVLRFNEILENYFFLVVKFEWSTRQLSRRNMYHETAWNILINTKITYYIATFV